MRSFLLDGLRQMVISKFGEVAAAVIDEQLRAQRKRPRPDGSKSDEWAGELTDGYVEVVREFLGIGCVDEVLELFGDYWIGYIFSCNHIRPRVGGGEEAVSKTLQDVNTLHHSLVELYAQHGSMPIFTLEPTTRPGYLVKCDGMERGLVAAARGMLRGLFRRIMPYAEVGVPTETVSVPIGQDSGPERVSFTFPIKLRRKSIVEAERKRSSKFTVGGGDVDAIFPFHIAFDYDMKVQQMGSRLCHMCPDLEYNKGFFEQCTVVRPQMAKFDLETLLDNRDTLFTIVTKTADGSKFTLNGQVFHFEDSELLVFVGAPTLKSLRQANGTLFDLPVFNRVCEIPFNFNLTEEELVTNGPQDGAGNGDKGSKEAGLLQMPSMAVLKDFSSGSVDSRSSQELLSASRITLYKFGQVSTSDSSEATVDLTTPVQKLLTALHKLKGSVDKDMAADIETVIMELSSCYDVYLPSLDGSIKQDDETKNYMASFFPMQSSLKFSNKSSRISRSASLAPRYSMSVTGSAQRDPTQRLDRRKSMDSLNSGRSMTTAADEMNVCTIRSFPQATMQGYMHRESMQTLDWQHRYFLLTDDNLFYYKSDQQDQRPLGVIHLQEFDRCREVTRRSVPCIELSGEGHGEGARSHFMHADTEEQTRRWLNVLMDRLTEIRMRRQQDKWLKLSSVRSGRALSESGMSTYVKANSLPQGSLGSIAERPRPPSEAELAWIAKLEDLDFDVFKVAEVTGGRPLQFVGKHILQNLGYLEKYNVAEDKLDNFLRCIEKGYKKDNPYHNSMHAADVTQTLYYFLITCEISQYLGDLDILAAIIAAIIHDFMHPGVNNAFHIATRSPEALVYNDQSVLENMHLSKAFQILLEDDCNIFGNLSAEDFRHVRAVIIHMVLNTDMSLHFELTGKFKSAITLLAEKGGAIGTLPNSTIMLILSMALHCADVSNQVKQTSLAVAWSERVMAEFWNQGDLERTKGQALSPMCDRNTVPIEKCQVSFINFIVEPLFAIFAEFAPELHDECIPNLKANKEIWTRRLKELEESEKAKAAAATDSSTQQ